MAAKEAYAERIDIGLEELKYSFNSRRSENQVGLTSGGWLQP
jgi:hypothetical protein